MPITILQYGIDLSFPLWAGTCPECGEWTDEYTIEAFRRPITSSRQRISDYSAIGTPEVAPTFQCEKCGCIWQWYSEG